LDEAESTIVRFARKFPGHAPLNSAIDLPYMRGDLESYERSLDQLQRDPRAGFRTRAALFRAQLSLLRGQLADHEKRLLELRRTGPALPSSVAINDSVLFSWIDVTARHDTARAARRLDATVSAADKLEPSQRSFRSIAAAYANAGLPDRAETILRRHRAERSDTAFQRIDLPRVDWTRGEIALAQHRYGDALALFRKADSLPDGPFTACSICLLLDLARVFDAAGQADSAIIMFKKYVNTPYSARGKEDLLDPLWLARVHERLGQLYLARHDNAQAKTHYEKFVSLWANADPVLQPRVSEAKRQLAALGSSR
jgi:tetratricopeptide (TPR) repeat protein